MKNLVFGLITTVMLSFSGFAGNLNNLKIENSPKREVRIEYTYKNQKVIVSKTSENEKEIQLFLVNELTKINQKSILEKEILTCTVTVSVGSGSTYMAVTISGTCAEIVAQAYAIHAQLQAEWDRLYGHSCWYCW